MLSLSLPTKADLHFMPQAARNDFDFWRGHIEPLLALEKVGMQMLRDLASRIDAKEKTVISKYYAARNHGITALVDKRLAGPGWWKGENVKLSKADQELVKTYCEQNQRSSKTAIKTMQREWARGMVRTETPVDPKTRMPRGWSARNLARYAPSKYELKSARIGRSAAASDRQLVYTTRKGLYVASHYMFDDMWHDFMVNTMQERQAGRPLELFSHDLFSARKVRWGCRVRTKKNDGTWNGLTEKMMRMILAATLYCDGFSPRGTVLVAEHGTAAISQKIEEALLDFSHKRITVSRSGMQGAAAHAGQYGGIVRGNPRHKASLESSNNLTHNVFASLPGQTGKDRQHQPEQLPALLKNNEALLAACNQLSPDRAALLQLPLLELNQFMSVAHELYGVMENDTDHDLEGWVECGHIVQELLIGGHWIDQRKLLADPAQSALALALLSQGTLEAKPRKMTRREVWDAGCRDLLKLPGYGVCAILGDDLASERKVRKGMFEFEDFEVGPGTHRFEAGCVNVHGERVRLADGETYQTFVNPFASDTLFVRRANGEYLGECYLINAPCRGDVEAVQRACGVAARAEAELLAPIRQRHMAEARQKAGRHEHNTRVLRGEPMTLEERAAADRAAARVTGIEDFLPAPSPRGGAGPEKQFAAADFSDGESSESNQSSTVSAADFL